MLSVNDSTGLDVFVECINLINYLVDIRWESFHDVFPIEFLLLMLKMSLPVAQEASMSMVTNFGISSSLSNVNMECLNAIVGSMFTTLSEDQIAFAFKSLFSICKAGFPPQGVTTTIAKQAGYETPEAEDFIESFTSSPEDENEVVILGIQMVAAYK